MGAQGHSQRRGRQAKNGAVVEALGDPRIRHRLAENFGENRIEKRWPIKAAGVKGE